MRKNRRVYMSIPGDLYDKAVILSKEEDIRLDTFIRQAIERHVSNRLKEMARKEAGMFPVKENEAVVNLQTMEVLPKMNEI